jgi:hypothetical protein
LKRARVKEAALAAERLAAMIAAEPAVAEPERPGLESLERALERATEPH